MPVAVHAEIKQLGEQEFSRIAYDVMGHVFAVRNEFGRLFDENIYHIEITRRTGGLMKVPVEVLHGDFRKLYFLDLLVGNSAVFELKAVESLTQRHRAQLLQYLMLTDLPRGKLVNLRPELIEHEFVNSKLTRAERTTFTVNDRDWDFAENGAKELNDRVTELLRDLGTGLDTALYEETLTHFLGGENAVVHDTDVFHDGIRIDRHPVLLATPHSNFKVSAVRDSDLPYIESHLRQFLKHTNLAATQWINVRHHLVTLKTLRRDGH